MLTLLSNARLYRAMTKSMALLMLAFTLACSPVENESDNAKTPKDARLFSGLSQQSSEQRNVQGQAQRQVQPGYQLKFPVDHASHPDYAVEWWYLTANLSDHQGKHYALQWTLFRFRADFESTPEAAPKSTPWSNQQQFMAHASLHSVDKSWFEERFARGGVGNAGVSHAGVDKAGKNNSPFQAQLDNWRWFSSSAALFPSSLQFTIEQDVRVTLNLKADSDFVLHGEQGYSRKLRGSNQASYYYSQPHIEIDGTVVIDNKDIQVSGQAWFDHEWTSQYLDPNTQGWDWFSIHLDNGDKLMLFNMRHQQQADFWSGSLIKADGTKIHLAEQDIKAQVLEHYQVAGRTLPLDWSIQLAEHGVDIQLKPFKSDQWNAGTFSYYEGAIFISGSHTGRGFIELTGY